MKKISGIFLIRNGDGKPYANGLTRIVRTRDLNKRLSEWRAASPSPLQVVGMITENGTKRQVTNWLQSMGGQVKQMDDVQVGEVSDTELCQSMRALLRNKLVQGEWFALDEALLMAIPLEHTVYAGTLAAWDSAAELVRRGSAAKLVGRASVVWEAVKYAHSSIPDCWHSSRYDFLQEGSERRDDMLDDGVTTWLAKKGQQDLGVIMDFHEQYEALTDLATKAGIRMFTDGDHFDYFLSWLVLQGQEAFAKLITNPALFSLLPAESCHEYETYFAQNALRRLLYPNPAWCLRDLIRFRDTDLDELVYWDLDEAISRRAARDAADRQSASSNHKAAPAV